MNNDIRERLQDTARQVQMSLPPNTGFVVLAFDFGSNVRCEYISNANRKDVVNVMREWIAKTEGSYMTHQDDGPLPPT